MEEKKKERKSGKQLDVSVNRKKKERKNIQTASNTRHETRCARRQAEGSHKFMID